MGHGGVFRWRRVRYQYYMSSYAGLIDFPRFMKSRASRKNRNANVRLSGLGSPMFLTHHQLRHASTAAHYRGRTGRPFGKHTFKPKFPGFPCPGW